MKRISKLWIFPLMICMMIGLLLPSSAFAAETSLIDNSYSKYEAIIYAFIFSNSI